ncbi:HesA/MoeB/ThiF family protein [Croceicoccus ponticola]|uniref:HesA/MoeB/ThiF family protein n=1 Tax=Croceicoccus ponticola TaxID=2217664 RepID=A0A437GXS8_9SPHN|nr:HesA/MoeB/ThiF family protein [Croceicoccus ponticola]RVQ67203.1 HesA/MoeB/ThiF family protein [Croceicoccus ponticola]
MLTPDRLDRFARHIVLPEIGGTGQVRLASSSVMLIGAGGVGSPALQYLAAAGIGRITVADCDDVDASNLQRQTIFNQADIAASKAERAADWVRRFDPAINVVPRNVRIDADNAAGLIAGHDLVLDGSDNFATRLAVSDACVASRVPLTTVAVGRFQGQVANFAGHLPDQACYRCWVGDAFDAEDCDTCADQGVLGAFVGMASTLGVMQALRVLLDGVADLGDPQWGKLLLLDGLKPAMRTIAVAKDPTCRACGG